MWIITEINTEMRLGKCKPILSEMDIIKKCQKEKVKIKDYWCSDGRYAGLGISDEDCKRIFKLE